MIKTLDRARTERVALMVLLVLALAAWMAPPATAAAKAQGLSRPQDWVAPDRQRAIKRAHEKVPFVSKVKDECFVCRQQRLRDEGYGIGDITDACFLLDSPIIKKQSDQYSPVRFMHSKHAAALNDCTVCHHLRPADPGAKETTRCAACHQQAFDARHPDRIGLKAAYHLRCIGCHEDMHKGPVDCLGCHDKNVPDHGELVKLPDNPEPSQVTVECLRCHQRQAKQFMKTAHWLWRGNSAFTMGRRKEVQSGKGTNAVNNF